MSPWKRAALRLEDVGEGSVIDLIRKSFPAAPDGVIIGIGDDAALVRAGRDVLVTKDLLAEGFDFIRGLHPPDLLGRKSLNVNLSDIAAMGGRPLYAVLGLGLPRTTKLEWVKKFLAGFRRAARQAGVSLIGGDLSQASSILVSVTVVGGAKKSVTRSGARPGDAILVSGTLGDAAGGLSLLEAGIRLGDGRDTDRLLKAFLDPSPRLRLGADLAERRLASAMIDISDGLSVDLAHISAESGVAADIELDKIPISKALRRRAGDPLSSALHGGEDFELLFTVRPKNVPRVLDLGGRHRVTIIGRITSGKGVLAIDSRGVKRPLPVGGYEHFRPKRGR